MAGAPLLTVVKAAFLHCWAILLLHAGGGPCSLAGAQGAAS